MSQNGFVRERTWKGRERKNNNFIHSLFFFFFTPSRHVMAYTDRPGPNQPKTNRTDLCRFLWAWGTASSENFSFPHPRHLSSHTKRTQVAWRTCGSFLRLQAGTARRTPIESAPLKKRPIEPGKRSTSLHPG